MAEQIILWPSSLRGAQLFEDPVKPQLMLGSTLLFLEAWIVGGVSSGARCHSKCSVYDPKCGWKGLSEKGIVAGPDALI